MPEVAAMQVWHSAGDNQILAAQAWLEHLGLKSKAVSSLLQELLAPAAAAGSSGDCCVGSGVFLQRPGQAEVEVPWYEDSLEAWQLQGAFVPLVKVVKSLHSRRLIHCSIQADNVMIMDPTPLRSAPHPAAMAAAHKAAAAHHEAFTEASATLPALLGPGKSTLVVNGAIRGVADGAAEEVWQQEMDAASAAAAAQGSEPPHGPVMPQVGLGHQE